MPQLHSERAESSTRDRCKVRLGLPGLNPKNLMKFIQPSTQYQGETKACIPFSNFTHVIFFTEEKKTRFIALLDFGELGISRIHIINIARTGSFLKLWDKESRNFSKVVPTAHG
jgi:hypothetical protein